MQRSNSPLLSTLFVGAIVAVFLAAASVLIFTAQVKAQSPSLSLSNSTSSSDPVVMESGESSPEVTVTATAEGVEGEVTVDMTTSKESESGVGSLIVSPPSDSCTISGSGGSCTVTFTLTPQNTEIFKVEVTGSVGISNASTDIYVRKAFSSPPDPDWSSGSCTLQGWGWGATEIPN